MSDKETKWTIGVNPSKKIQMYAWRGYHIDGMRNSYGDYLSMWLNESNAVFSWAMCKSAIFE